MSSRSLAAARSRRAGENPPPVSGNRPGTSIGGQAAFAQQQNPYQPSSNVRVARQGQQQPLQEPAQQNKMPFNKISISDAIGLVTLRLGRVEQYIIESEHEKEVNGSSEISGGGILDSSILNNMISRLDSLEKREPVTNTSGEELTKFTEQLTRLSDECNKHTLAIAKHTEQLFRFERDLTETKDILKTFMIKYDTFATDTNTRFSDFEYALSEVEKALPTIEGGEQLVSEEVTDSNISEGDSNSIMSAELKNMIKQEFSN